MDGSVAEILEADVSSKLVRPLFMSSVTAGFPTPAEDYIEKELDLNKHLVKRPSSTFYVRVAGDSMINERIFPNDLLIVDRAAASESGDVVVALVNGEFCVKLMKVEEGRVWLVPANDAYPAVEITGEMEFEVWGRVMSSVHLH